MSKFDVLIATQVDFTSLDFTDSNIVADIVNNHDYALACIMQLVEKNTKQRDGLKALEAKLADQFLQHTEEEKALKKLKEENVSLKQYNTALRKQVIDYNEAQRKRNPQHQWLFEHEESSKQPKQPKL